MTPDFNIAGCLDALMWNRKKRCLQIFDFKSNKQFKVENKYQKLKAPFDDLEASSLNIYSLQLSTYKFFIQKMTGLTIGDLWVVHFDRTTKDYKMYKCKDLTKKDRKCF